MIEERIFKVLEERYSRYLFAGLVTFLFIHLSWIQTTAAYIFTPIFLFILYPIILIMLKGTWRLLLVITLIVGLLVIFEVEYDDLFGKSEPYEEIDDPRYDPGY